MTTAIRIREIYNECLSITRNPLNGDSPAEGRTLEYGAQMTQAQMLCEIACQLAELNAHLRGPGAIDRDHPHFSRRRADTFEVVEAGRPE